MGSASSRKVVRCGIYPSTKRRVKHIRHCFTIGSLQSEWRATYLLISRAFILVEEKVAGKQ
uniref:Uncharacterized protein n=1 Tax=Hyaloperonospora arabidopsidis (strain Emoy2) TaxID=559515 RepID=M4B7B8_HYAAE